MEGGWFDEEAIAAERFDADMEQAAMEAEGRAFGKRMKRVKAALATGDVDAAAKLCATHGWSGCAVEGVFDGDRRCYYCGALFREVARGDYDYGVRTVEAGAFPVDVTRF